MITLNLGNISDSAVKQALESLVEQVNSKEILLGEWDSIEYNFAATGTFKINHRLNFKPQDIIELSRASTLSAVTYNFSNFLPTTVEITVTGSGVLRFLVGKHRRA